MEETLSFVARDGPVVRGSVLLDFAVTVRLIRRGWCRLPESLRIPASQRAARSPGPAELKIRRFQRPSLVIRDDPEHAHRPHDRHQLLYARPRRRVARLVAED
jgi:hypothetical protein